MKNINISRTFPSSKAAYEISWHTVISAIKRRKHLGEKTVDDLSVEDFEQLRIEIAAVMDFHVDDLLEMSFESIDIVLNL